jgi:hypothetical protein
MLCMQEVKEGTVSAKYDQLVDLLHVLVAVDETRSHTFHFLTLQ